MAYDTGKYGNVFGSSEPQPPRQPPSWGFVPTSYQSYTPTLSTQAPNSISGIDTSSGPYSSYPSQDSFPVEFAEYQDPVKEAKDQMKKLEKKDRRKKQKRRDNKTAAEWLMFLGLFNAIMWVIPIFGSGWHQRMFNGFGIGFTRIHTSLFSIHVNTECHVMQWPFGIDSEQMAKLSPEHQVCKIFQHMNGTHSLHSAKDLACALTNQACWLMESVWYSSFFLIFSFAVNALCSLLAGLFLYFYWYQEHLKVIRNLAMIMFMITPIIGTVAFASYNILMPDIGELPRSWTSMVSTFNAGTGLGEIRAIGGDSLWIRYGWCWFFVYITIAWTLAAPISWKLWFGKHPDEKQHELNAVNEKLELENAIMEVENEEDYYANGQALADNDARLAAQQAQQLGGYYPPQSGGAYPPQSGGAYGAYAPQSGAGQYGYGQGAQGYGAGPYATQGFY